ncbi:MAG TPA: type II toxin-antitoxin system RelE/ParE family toxin [Alphaproteobacteria bacterium]
MRLFCRYYKYAGVDALRSAPSWRVHQLWGHRKGIWSLSVSRNWRLTFRIDEDSEVVSLDLEDYH